MRDGPRHPAKKSAIAGHRGRVTTDVSFDEIFFLNSVAFHKKPCILFS
jgi:hypothetical protein